MRTRAFTSPTPTSIRIVRLFDAHVALVWRAHTEPELVKQWMTCLSDHSLPICEIDLRARQEALRQEWMTVDGPMATRAGWPLAPSGSSGAAPKPREPNPAQDRPHTVHPQGSSTRCL